MPNFPKNKGFKLPGMGSKEIDTPGNFRKEQKVEDVGYCSDTESHMLPKGSSPLLATDSDLHDTSWLVPRADKPSYTGSRAAKPWPTKKKREPVEAIEGPEAKGVIKPEFNIEAAGPTADIPKIPIPTGKKDGGLKTYAQAWADNDSGIQQMYKNFESYVADVSGQGETASKAGKRKRATEGGYIHDEDIHY
tara:strand:- start:1191 stop:1766 length:576 start_codon:yes stop_codon:yes gene_type:complete